jgi:WD40 repeat protein
VRVYHGHKHWVKAVCFTPDGGSLISAGLAKQIFVWLFRSRKAGALADGDNDNNSGGGSGGGGGGGGGGDEEAGRPKQVLETHADYVLDMLVLPSNQRLVTTAKDKTIRVFNWQTGQQLVVIRNHEFEFTR